MREDTIPCVLAIGGMDPSGGAGLTADARALAAFGAHCCPVTTAVVAQNTCAVAAVEPVSLTMLALQLDNLLADVTVQAVKVGVLPSRAAIHLIAGRLRQLRGVPIIVDPVFAPSGGKAFCDDDTVRGLMDELLPLADLVTPNLPEAVRLSDQSITDRSSLVDVATLILNRSGARYVLVKGGHRTGADGPPTEALDVLCGGSTVVEFAAPWIAGREVRGTGCVLASAIAAQRARGVEVAEAVGLAKDWLTEQIRNAKVIGAGRRVATL